MNSFRFSSILSGSRVTAFAVVFGTTSIGQAQVVYSGDYVLPPNLVIGDTGTGSLAITNGGAVSSASGIIGNLTGSSGSVTVDGAGSTWTNSGDFIMGNMGAGSLAITNGGSVFGYGAGGAYIANSLTGTGSVTVDGLSSTWTLIGAVRVSVSDSTGSLAITNGGSVSCVGAFVGYSGSGTATVDGPGSTWTNPGLLVVGGNGPHSGSLVITNGGFVSSGGFDGAVIGLTSSIGTSSVTVDGTNSTWRNSGGVIVGGGGKASLEITNGGSVSSVGAVVGFSGQSPVSGWGIEGFGMGTATVDGKGSTWTNSGSLYISYGSYGGLDSGDISTGKLAVTNGGSVSSVDAFIGYSSGGIVSTGTAIVDGKGSTWTNSGSLYVGYSGGTGSLAVTNGGTVSSVGAFVSFGSSSSGTVTVDGAITNSFGQVSPAGTSWTNTGTLAVGVGGTVSASKVNLLGGTIELFGTLDPTSITISGDGTLTGTGTIVGDVSNSGIVDLGASFTRALSVIGNYTQNRNGKLQEYLDSATLNGMLDVTGNLTLGGTLDLDLVGGFTPTVGEIFDLINVTDGTISGGFSTIVGSDPGAWMVLYNPAGNQQVDLECVSAIVPPVPDNSNSALLVIIGVAGIAVAARGRQDCHSASHAGVAMQRRRSVAFNRLRLP